MAEASPAAATMQMFRVVHGLHNIKQLLLLVQQGETILLTALQS